MSKNAEGIEVEKNSQKRTREFLALTGLQAFWDTSKPMLLLGRWCHPFYEDSLPSNVDIEFLEHPNIEKINSMKSIDYTLKIYEALLPKIAMWLNNQHNTNYSLCYWRSVIGSFLLLYIQTVYYRYVCIKTAYSLYSDILTIGLDQHSFVTPVNSTELFTLAQCDAWNQQLCTQILSFTGKPPFRCQKYSIKRHVTVCKYRKLTILKIKFASLLARIVGKHAVLANLENPYRSLLRSKLRILPYFVYGGKDFSGIKTDDLRRESLEKIGTEDNFSRLVLHTLKINLPMSFLEGYEQERKIIRKTLPKKAAVALVPVIQNDRIQIWAAGLKEKAGTKIIAVQHGGAYGMSLVSIYETIERTNSDFYFTWGWKESDSTIPLSIDDTKKIKNSASGDNILFLSLNGLRYPHAIGLASFTSISNYAKRLHQFVDYLSEISKAKIILRLCPRSTSKQIDWYKKNASVNVFYSDDRGSFIPQLLKAKVLVCDNMGTTFLFALTYNIPTIVYWSAELYPIRESAKPYLADLERVGVYYDSPEKAALKLNKIVDNPLPWWSSDEVQSARRKFCNQFARLSDRWTQERIDALLQIAEGRYNV